MHVVARSRQRPYGRRTNAARSTGHHRNDITHSIHLAIGAVLCRKHIQRKRAHQELLGRTAPEPRMRRVIVGAGRSCPAGVAVARSLGTVEHQAGPMIPETDEHRMIRESVGLIAAEFGHDYFTRKAKADERPTELWQAIGSGGFIGVNVSEEYGGGGMGISELVVVIEELAHHGCPLLLLVVSPAICASVITLHGSAEQKQRYLPGIASGERIMAFAITEPNAGSNSHNISTVATRTAGGWKINGSKVFITGVDEADDILVVTRTNTDEVTGAGRLSLFVVPSDAPGLRADPLEMAVIAPERQFTLFFDDVGVEDDALVGHADDGLRAVFSGLNPERIAGAAICSGLSRYALDKAAEYASERKVWDVPIGSHQGIAHPMAEAYIDVQMARLVTWRAASLYDTGEDAQATGEAANIAKFAAADAFCLAMDQAIQTHGGSGLTSEVGLADLWFVGRLLKTAPISREMILNFVARHSLGLPRSY